MDHRYQKRDGDVQESGHRLVGGSMAKLRDEVELQKKEDQPKSVTMEHADEEFGDWLHKKDEEDHGKEGTGNRS